jgi:hypothetical protein
MDRIRTAWQQIEFARTFTLSRLVDIAPADWLRMPTEGVTHLAWQLGHLAMAEYRLTLERWRGVQPSDANLISPAFLQLFGRGSVPVPEARVYPTIADIRAVFDAVHEQARREVAEYADADWDTPALTPHPLFTHKGGALLWCSHHETLHVGQIGLLRRLLGRAPLW